MSMGEERRPAGSLAGAPRPGPADGEPESAPDATRERVRSGKLTALLEEIAAVPEVDSATSWSDWLAPGLIVGRFEMLREIGRGGFGVVWEARDLALHRSVAFKAVWPGTKARLREERLLREAEAAARLSHPNIVTLHDVGRTDQGPYLVLELLSGETLAERLERGRLPVREALRVGLEIAKGVAHAHAHGVVHRDLKPANVFLCRDGQVKVLDFGMAQAFGQRRQDGGTPSYMAPEQWAGAPEDERTDVFALGTMLFEMVSGELPFPPPRDGERPARSSWRAARLDVKEAPALGELVRSTLEKDPTQRPRDGGEVLALLMQLQEGLQRTTGTLEEVRTRRRPRLRTVASIASGVLLGLAMVLVATWHASRDPVAAGDGRLLVAVADFSNETRDPDLDGLSGLLITSLEQSRKLRVLTRGRMVDVVRELGRGDPPHIDESLARDVGRRAGVRTLLLASIRKLGDTYAAELRAVDPQKDEYLFTVREQALGKNELLPLIDRISERTRLALHEPEADVKTSAVAVAEGVTPNLEAYRHYFAGKDLAARVRLKEAAAELERAVEIDPRFALAQVDLAWVGYLSSALTRVQSREIVRAAARNAAHAPAKEAGLIRIVEAFFDGRFGASRAELRALAPHFPDDRDLAILAGEILEWSGYYEEAAPAYERAIRLAPDWDVLRFDQVGVLNYTGRGREALQVAEAAARQRATPTARAVQGFARYMAGDVDGGIAAFRSSGADDLVSRSFLAEGLAWQGRIEDALATVATIDDPRFADVTRARVLAYAGRLEAGLASMEAAGRRPGADVPFNRQTTAWYLAAAGELDRARRMADQGDFFTSIDSVTLAEIRDDRRLREFLSQMGDDQVFLGRFLRAVAAHFGGDDKAALAQLRALDQGTVSFVPFFHGVVAAETRADEEAVEALRRFERVVFCGTRGFQGPWYVARSRFLMARSLDRLGRRDEARKVLDLQLARWKDADAGLPLLVEMKALREALHAPRALK
jgi:serine/threonine protein kinase/tetratricopeptide (TPR) repeat protein